MTSSNTGEKGMIHGDKKQTQKGCLQNLMFAWMGGIIIWFLTHWAPRGDASGVVKKDYN